MHSAYVGRSSYYTGWPSGNVNMFDGCDQPSSAAVDRSSLIHGRPLVTEQTHPAGDDYGFHVGSSPDCHVTGSAPQLTADVKANLSTDESFCSSDDQPPSKSSVDEFIAPLPLPSCRSRCPPSAVDVSGQSFGPLPTFPGGYPFPMLPPASTASLVPPPPGYRLALGASSRGRLQRPNIVKASTKLTSSPRSRPHSGQYTHYTVESSAYTIHHNPLTPTVAISVQL